MYKKGDYSTARVTDPSGHEHKVDFLYDGEYWELT